MKMTHLEFPPLPRLVLLLGLYAVVLTTSLWLAYELRFDFHLSPNAVQERAFVLRWLVPVQLIALGLCHQWRPLLDYFSTPDLGRILHALLLGSLFSLLVWFTWGAGYAPPRGIMMMDFLFSLVGIGAFRLALRRWHQSPTAARKRTGRKPRRVAILGAGDTGAMLAQELLLKPGTGLQPVAFFDDDPAKQRARVHDLRVFGPLERLPQLVEQLALEEAIIAMPSAPAKRVGEMVQLLHAAHLPCRTVPSLNQLALGKVRVDQLRQVEIQDLLGRETVAVEAQSLQPALENRVVLVTGAGGSIGSELCRQIAATGCRRLVLLDRSEPGLFQIEQELLQSGHREIVSPQVGDILDQERMQAIFREFHPEYVFHAAAHKHVPLMEHQPAEAIRNNCLGTAQLADLALEYRADRFTLISTDKAINPTSVMGATKRLAEIYVQALQAAQAGATRFMAVRFGNVLGSSGSVIPRFHQQIARGGPVQVTHPDMTRYFMTIPEASLLVLQSAVLGSGGEIFVLDMGRPVKILELARQMIALSGLTPGQDIRIEFTGVRPGEKLFEEVTRQGEDFVATSHPKIFRFRSPPQELSRVRQTLQRLCSHLHEIEGDKLKARLQAALPDYRVPPEVRGHCPAAAPSLQLPTLPAQPVWEPDNVRG